MCADRKNKEIMSDQKENLFPSMGDIASRTNALADVEDDDKRLAHDAPTLEQQEDGEEREVQEIESLCMRCHEQVSSSLLYMFGQIIDIREQRDCY
jgi:zinc finger protein